MFYIDVNEKVKLKLLIQKDKNEFYKLICKNREHLMKFMPRIGENKSLEDTEKVIELFLQQLEQNNGFRAGIAYDGLLVGIIGLKYIDWLNKKTEIMYWIDKDYSGKGIATICTSKALQIAFEDYGLNKAILKICSTNYPSIRIAEKCGFKLDGVHREDELLLNGFVNTNVYSILKSDYEGVLK